MSALGKIIPMPRKVEFDAPHRMRAIREAQGLSLEKLAEKLGHTVTINQLSRLERGMNQLTHQRLVQVAEALGVSAADILPPEEGGLTDDERQLVDAYRAAHEALRAGFDALREASHQFHGEPPNEPPIAPLDRKAG